MEPENKQAVALQYHSGSDAAPIVVANGKGEMAQRIIEIAGQHQIPRYRDPTLVKLLAMLPVGVEIPPELYAAVAEVLVFIYQLDRKQTPTSKK